ncbi:hypothetical protein E2C01_013229 [Portunus trituberculatus]|uniref:Uncharacterized protein n=1 Tax=Portunus trituberculatus TaxID=210409 RepID=A0A5B7DGD5_PORTR|nr:hypothetical protein [Portunus trituberculatus]
MNELIEKVQVLADDINMELGFDLPSTNFGSCKGRSASRCSSQPSPRQALSPFCHSNREATPLIL